MQPKYTLRHIAYLIQAELQGDPDTVITGINALDKAKKGDIAFLDNARYQKYLPDTHASAVILSANDSVNCKTNALVTANPYLAYAKVAKLFEKALTKIAGIHPSAIIGKNCQIHSTASIGPNAVIGDEVIIEADVTIGAHCVIGERSIIGANTRLWSGVTLYHAVNIGRGVIIHSGAVIGSDGFGNANEKGAWFKVPQLGGVRIGDNVEIGANTTIDRGALEDTIIEEGVRLDNQIQIAHNVIIGAHTAIAACTGIAGSAKIGKYCLIGGGVGIAGHIEIADKVMITGMSGITHSIKQPGVYSSTMPAMESKKWWKILAYLHKFAEVFTRLRKIEKIIEQRK